MRAQEPDSHERRQAEWRGLAWVGRFVHPHRLRLAVILALSLLSTALGLAQPYITKYLIDDGLLAGQFSLVVWLCALLVGAGIVAALLGALNRWHYTDVSSRILFALREAVFAHLERLSPDFHARARGGDLLARLDGDIAEVQRFAVDSLLAIVNGGLALVGALALMLSLSPPLTVLALLMLPASAIFLRWVRPRIERGTRTLRERASGITAFFFEKLSAVKFIQSVGGEARESRRLETLHQTYRVDLLSLQMTNYAASAVPNVLVSLNTAIVFVAGGYLVIEGKLSLGTLIAFSAYLARANGPVQTLLGLYAAFQRARVSLLRIMEITQVPPEVSSPPQPQALPQDATGALSFECVHFGYDEQPDVLSGVSVQIPSGAKVCLVGASGAGKTTLIDLLHRHYDPRSGCIRLHGIDIRQLELAALRRAIAVVSQDTVLFAGSIAENIRYARPAASDAEVEAAADRAEVMAFTGDLAAGLESEIGARGMTLSGGQRQRISIARALLQDPLVLVLDEAMSALDRQTHQSVVQAVDALFAARTRIVISHRDEALAGADRIYLLESGKLVAQNGSARAATGRSP